MENNCLIADLDRAAQNDNLREVGELRFLSIAGVDSTGFGWPVKLELISGDATVLKNGVTYHLPYDNSEGGFISVVGGTVDSIIKVTPKYNITNINKMICCTDIDLSEFKYSKISVIENYPGQTYLIHGDIAYIAKPENYTSTSFCPRYCTHIYGNLSLLGTLPNLVRIDLTSTKIEGSIEDFVEKELEQGRYGINIRFLSNTIVTYQGIKLSNVAYNLSWDENGNITLERA